MTVNQAYLAHALGKKTKARERSEVKCFVCVCVCVCVCVRERERERDCMYSAWSAVLSCTLQLNQVSEPLHFSVFTWVKLQDL